jgi:CRP/FNR family transcriptional regulator, cyclic AMP receptor protein
MSGPEQSAKFFRYCRTRVEKMSSSPLLRPDEWLGAQPKAFRDALAGMGRRRILAAGTPLYRREDWGGIYGVQSGCLEIAIEFACSSLVGLHFAYPGYFIGNRPIKTGRPYAVSVSARLDSEIQVIAFNELQQMVCNRPEWWRCLAMLTDHWFDVGVCGGIDLMLRKPEARCIAALLRLGGYRPFERISEQPRFVPVTQKELAENANLSRSTVNEILALHDKDGLIARSYGGIEILKPSQLQQKLDSISN